MSSAAIPPALENPFAPYISQIDALSNDDVLGEERLGPGFNFGAARPTLEAIRAFMDQLRFLDGRGMPSRLVGQSISRFQELVNTMQQMKGFDLRNYSGNFNALQNLTQQLKDRYESLVEAAVPVVLYGQLRSSGIMDAQARTQGLLADFEKQRNELTGIVDEAKELLSSQKKFSAEIAIAGYGTLFAKEARAHDAAAKIWLAATGVLAGLVAIAGVINYRSSVSLLYEFSRATTSQTSRIPASLTLQFTFAKVILFTIGLSAAYWSARVYRSHRHNSIVNKHRANALTSFQEFVDATTDPEVRNAVLLQTTSCIYAPQPTGFSSGNDTDGESPFKILEIVRNLQK